jgi:hypothetical protein
VAFRLVTSATRNADALRAALVCRSSPDGRGLLIQLAAGHAGAALAGLAAGRWTLQLDWRIGPRHHHHEQPIRRP